MPSHFKVQSLIVCDDIRREENKKEILIGVYNNVILVPTLPFVTPQMAFRVGVTIEKADYEKIEFEVRDPHKGRWWYATGSSTFANAQDPASVSFFASPALFQNAGKYRVFFGMDSPMKTIGEFEIRPRQISAAPA